MPKDFAKKKRANKTPPRKQAKPSAPPAKRQLPGWLWLSTGALLGAFLMFLVKLSDVPANKTTAPSPKAAENQPKALPKPEFDFYEILKSNEVVVDEPDEAASQKALVESREYILQAGSFRNSQDADRMRAELILKNLTATVETVKTGNGQTWHRVMVGPFTSRSKMAKARSILASNNISPLLLTRKKSDS